MALLTMPWPTASTVWLGKVAFNHAMNCLARLLELPREAAPVALTEQGRGDDGLAMWLSNDLACLDGTVEVAGYEGVDVYVFHPVAYCTGLFFASVVEFTGSLSLKDLCFVGHGLAVAY